ncbi:MAG TPA: cell division protein ZapA [Alphaproteobacteria bacterium]|jgi:cell division protein ZapA|nr:cell division protein ZapA [Alphaproteobacteria bacterium]
MAQVSVTINGRVYDINCDDGQEEHVAGLAGYVDDRVADLARSMGQIGDARLLVMASLLISDELVEAAREIQGLKSRSEAEVEERVMARESDGIDALSSQLEELAARLERA